MYNIKEQLIEKSSLVKKNAYAPYSKFKVGASILTSNNNIYSGCNVENAAYGATLCAEGSVIASMIAHGEYNIAEMAISSSSDKICYPCGICIQKILEFSDDNTIIHICLHKKIEKSLSINQLLPYGFNKNMLI